AEDLSVQAVESLRWEVRRGRVPSVALADVEVPVRPEGAEAAGMGVRRVREDEDVSARGRVGSVGVGRALELPDDCPVLPVRVVDVEEAGGGVVGSEREREEAFLLALDRDVPTHVEKRLCESATVIDDPDTSGAFDDEEPRIPGCRGDVDGV